MSNESNNPSLNAGQGASPDLHANDDSIDYIKQYIDASAESADRTRFVLLIMVTASILAFVAVWNSRREAWPISRLIVATDAQKFYDSFGQIIRCDDDEALRQEIWPRFFEQQVHDRMKDDPKKQAEYMQGREQAYQSAKLFVEGSRFANLEHLKNYVAYLERSRAEKIMNITVPFFGVVFDINDLGIFAGITFVIILLLFRFSLLRELRNLLLVFLQAKTPEHLRLCYDMLAMQQVLTMPPQLERGLPERNFRNFGWWREAFWNVMSKILYLLPFLVQLGIFRHDLRSYKEMRVEDIYPGSQTGLIFTGTLLGVNALLTGLCIYLGWQVDGRWRKHAEWILSNTPGDPGEITAGGETPPPAELPR